MSDLISAYLNKNKSDKCYSHTYQAVYDEFFKALDRNAPLNILEVGIEKGGSLCAWKEYLPNARVIGVDIVDARLPEFKRDNVEFILGDIKDYKIDTTFDIIIEDGSHSNEAALWAAVNLSKHLKVGGILFIEDIQEGFAVPFILWGQLNGPYIVNAVDMRRLTNKHDNFIVAITKVA